MKEDWIHYKTIGDGQYCGLDGINIWDYQWHSNYETILIKDPTYGEEKKFNKYWIELDNRKIEFVAGEFSNCVWGIFTRKTLNKITKESLEYNFNIARELVNEADILQRIANGGNENTYDFLTVQILSDILNKKGNLEIIENTFKLLIEKIGERKFKLKKAKFDIVMADLVNNIRAKI